MFKKIMKRLVNNLGLKILSILLAVVLWMIVVDIDDPEITKRYTIPVTITNTEDFEELGKVYEIVEDSNVAIIQVTGKRSYVDELTGADFTATADLSQIIDLYDDGNEKLVPINISARRYEKYLTINQKTVNMKILIEDLSTNQTYITCEAAGVPAEGYAIGDVTVSPNLIKISGPQSIVSQVSRIVASVNVDGLSEDITASVVPVLYNEKNQVIESDQVTLSQEKVDVNIQILSTKSVPVVCETTGTVAEGYYFAGLEYAPASVSIKGEANVLNNIQQIVIPGEAINLEGATADVENSIDITAYLEEGVSLVNQEEQKIAVKAIVLQLEVKDLELPVITIQKKNLAEGYEMSFDKASVTVPVRGRSEDLAVLTVGQMSGTINLEGLGPGSHIVPVEVVLDERYQLMGEVMAEIQITETPQESEDTPSEEGDTDNTGDNNADENSGADNSQQNNGEQETNDSQENTLADGNENNGSGTGDSGAEE